MIKGGNSLAGVSGGSDEARSARLSPGGAGVDRRLSSSEGVLDVTEVADDVGRSETDAAF